MDSDSNSKKPCPHYKRFCELKAPCCGKFYACRFCHDEDSTHEMDRYKVEEVKCCACGNIQKVSQKCEKCQNLFGEYFCAVCRLYDIESNQYHCDSCGLCRVGPKSKFYHCEKCNTCLNKDLKDNHKCVENMSMSCCPICQEFLHTSRQGIHIPHCGHMIHTTCLESYWKQGLFTCPLCKESIMEMDGVWEQMDQACAQVRLPPELQNVTLDILCQDCHKECKQKFNTEGLKCLHCGGYNTAQI